jgi:hypothetical protein
MQQELDRRYRWRPSTSTPFTSIADESAACREHELTKCFGIVRILPVNYISFCSIRSLLNTLSKGNCKFLIFNTTIILCRNIFRRIYLYNNLQSWNINYRQQKNIYILFIIKTLYLMYTFFILCFTKNSHHIYIVANFKDISCNVLGSRAQNLLPPTRMVLVCKLQLVAIACCCYCGSSFAYLSRISAIEQDT